jgi:hypothetical protein
MGDKSPKSIRKAGKQKADAQRVTDTTKDSEKVATP